MTTLVQMALRGGNCVLNVLHFDSPSFLHLAVSQVNYLAVHSSRELVTKFGKKNTRKKMKNIKTKSKKQKSKKTKKYLNYLKYIWDDSGPHEPACCEVYSFLESFLETYDCVVMQYAE